MFLCGACEAPKVSTRHQKNCAPESLILSALKLPLCELAFLDIDSYILTEDINFKILLRENYAIVLDSCYMFTKKTLKMDFNTVLMKLMEFTVH